MQATPEVQELLLRINASTALLERELKKGADAIDKIGSTAERSSVRYDASMKRVEDATRRSQFAMRNLGFQIGDIGSSLAAGSSPFVVLAQQGGQVAGAMAGLSGAVGRLGAFLTGPFGAALLTVTTLLGSLWFNSRRAAGAAEEHKTALEQLAEATKRLDEITGRGNKTLEERAQQEAQATFGALIAAKARRQQAQAELELALARAKAAEARAFDPTLAGEGGFNPGAVSLSRYAAQVAALKRELSGLNDQVLASEDSLRVFASQIRTGTLGGNKPDNAPGATARGARISPVADAGADMAVLKRAREDFLAAGGNILDLPEYKGVFDGGGLKDLLSVPKIDVDLSGLDAINDKLREAARQGEYFRRDLSRGLADSIVFGDKLGTTLVNTFKRAAAAFLESRIFDFLSGAGGGFFSSLGSLFGGPRAEGGYVSPGRAYLVGERGPEVLVPNTGGRIVPNHAMGGGTQRVIVEVAGGEGLIVNARLAGAQGGQAAAVELIRRTGRPRLPGRM